MILPQALRGALGTSLVVLVGSAWAEQEGAAFEAPTDSRAEAALCVPRCLKTDASSLPVLGALGASLRISPEHPGARHVGTRLVPNYVVRWGTLSITNGGALASRAGEPAESGLSAELLSRDRLHLGASLSLDQGRDSSRIERLAGLHDIPSHLRGRLRVGWRLHEHWEASATLRGDLSGRGTGHSIETTLLHQWRPEFLDHTRWGISIGGSAEWLDAEQANALHGVTQEDARRSRYPVYRLDSGIGEWRLFTNWRREMGGNWLAFGHLTVSRLSGSVAGSPLVQKRSGLSLSLGIGKRF